MTTVLLGQTGDSHGTVRHMGDAIASGVFALGGALVGALASFLATTAEARNRRRDAEEARHDALLQSRRALYSTLVERADLAADAARRMWAHTAAADIERDDHASYVKSWEAFVQARAAVEIVGPQRAAAAAQDLSQSISDLCNYVDAWIDGKRLTRQTEAEFVVARETRARCRRAFIDIAQDVLDTGS